jgi:hypothetical protein
MILILSTEKLWPTCNENATVMGWFCIIKAVFQLNDITKFAENDLFSVQEYLEVSDLYIHTYHSRFIPEGVAELSQIFLRDTHVLPKLVSYEEHCRRDRW